MRSFLGVYLGTGDTHLSQTILGIIGVESSPMHVMRDYRSRELTQGEDKDPFRCCMQDQQIASYGLLRATRGVSGYELFRSRLAAWYAVNPLIGRDTGSGAGFRVFKPTSPKVENPPNVGQQHL